MRLWGRRVSVIAFVVLAACGGGDGGSDAGDGAEGGTTDEPSITTDIFSHLDYDRVCNGTPVPEAPAYEATAGVHPFLTFSKEADTYQGETLLDPPPGWTTDYETYKDTELVACLDLTSEELLETCEGYEDDETGDVFVVELYRGTYEVRLLEASTAEEVATGTIEAPDDDCPFLITIDEDEDPQREYADFQAPLLELVGEHVEL